MVNDEGSNLWIKRMNLNHGTLHLFSFEHLHNGVYLNILNIARRPIY
jgi:hypothetical protein